MVMTFRVLSSQIFVFSLDLLCYFEEITDVLYITDTDDMAGGRCAIFCGMYCLLL